MCDGGSGGDGGAAERKKAEDKRIAEATNRINVILGQENAKPYEVDRADFTTITPGGYDGLESGTRTHDVTTFDQAGFDAAMAKAAADAEASKTAFGERLKLYDKAGADAKTKAMIDLDKEHAITGRETSFDIARAGLTGGSRDIDSNREVLDTYQQGVLKAGTMADQVKNSMRSADDKTRVGLIDSIRTGLDQGSATNQAYDAMRNNYSQATAEANNVSLTGFFDRLNQINQQRKYNNGVVSGGALAAPVQRNNVQLRDFDGTIYNVG
jgi:hypothetical protein